MLQDLDGVVDVVRTLTYCYHTGAKLPCARLAGALEAKGVKFACAHLAEILTY